MLLRMLYVTNSNSQSSGLIQNISSKNISLIVYLAGSLSIGFWQKVLMRLKRKILYPGMNHMILILLT